MTFPPLLSVIIPSYNHANLLPRAVQSVLSCADSRIELIVVDDGSVDNSAQVLAQLHKEYGKRLQSVRQDNQGPAAARNQAVQIAKGNFILPLDADDELLPDVLPVLLDKLTAQPDVCFWLAAHCSVREDGKMRQHLPGTVPDDLAERMKAWLLHKRIGICHGACIFRRDLLLERPYPNLPSSEDLPVFAYALLQPQVIVLKMTLSRIHKSQDSRRHDVKAAQQQGLLLVDELFCNLPVSVQYLKSHYFAQCCLSLFRTSYLSGDFPSAQQFYRKALASNWRVLFKLSYTRKALRLWLRR